MFYKKEFGLLKQTPKRFFKSPKLIDYVWGTERNVY